MLNLLLDDWKVEREGWTLERAWIGQPLDWLAFKMEFSRGCDGKRVAGKGKRGASARRAGLRTPSGFWTVVLKIDVYGDNLAKKRILFAAQA